MPVLVSNDTYTRLVFDSDDIVPVLKIDGRKIIEMDALDAEIAKAKKQAREIAVDMAQRVREGAVPIPVTYRLLRGADKVELEDTIHLEYGASAGQAHPGTMRRFVIAKAVVSWDFAAYAAAHGEEDIEWSEDVLDGLDPSVWEQLYAWVSWGSKPPEQDPATGLPLDEEPAPPAAPANRAQRRASGQKGTSSGKKTPSTTKEAPASGS